MTTPPNPAHKGRDGRAGIDAALVKRLIASQFPQWSDLPVEPVEVDGWDNRTYRLGGDLTVRLPTAAGYSPAIDKEDRWLPVLAPQLPVAVPELVATGEPQYGYPFGWSIRRWIDGATAHPDRIENLADFATAVATFLLALQSADATGGPTAGAHSFHRGCPPEHYHDQAQRSLKSLHGLIDTHLVAEVWQHALDARWRGEPTWFHGDVAHGNLLVRDGKLAAVIDFGTCGVGDPACDLVIAWTMFGVQDGSREAFRTTVAQDEGTWARARGWAVWKAMLVLAQNLDQHGRIPSESDDPEAATTAEEQLRVIEEVLADHVTAA